VTEGAVADTIVAPYNEVPTLDESIAAVLVEPVAANMNLVAPGPGFLEGLRAECDRVGALLIFDEVITGFRLSRGGAEEFFSVTPDLWCFGKVIGGGLPVGAFGGSKWILSSLAPLGPVYQAGTLSGNPLATAAGATVLNHVTIDELALLAGRVRNFATDLEAAIRDAGLFALTPNVGPLIGLYLAYDEASAPTNFAEAKVLNENGLYAKFFHAMLDRGVALAPGAYEILFTSMSHTDDDLERTVSIAADAAKEVLK
jgi:glutamate-1-semialdehyde 2,1-aminomutase